MDQEKIQKISLIKIFLTIGIVVLFLFGIDNLVFRNNPSTGLVEIFLSLCFGLNFIVLMITKSDKPASVVVVIVLMLALLFMYIDGGIGGRTGILWYFTYPVVAVFLLGQIPGGLSTLTLLALTLAIHYFYKTPFSLIETRQLIISTIVMTMLVRFYWKLNRDNNQKIKLKSEELEKYSEIIKQNEAETNAKNIDLQKTKTAMINLLEDARELELELKNEKLSIEKKIEERTKELEDEKGKLASSIEALLKAFVMIDLDGNVILKNNNLNKVFNKKKESWTLNDIQKEFGESFDFVDAYKKQLKNKRLETYSDILVGSRYLEVRLSPVFGQGKSGKLIGVLAIVGDITEEKILQRSRDEFFSIASHELRTPLTAIRGNASLIKDHYSSKLKDKELVEMIDDIEESSIRLIDIVNDFLNMGRLEQGRMQFDVSDFDLVELAEETVKHYQVTGSRMKLYLKVDKPKEKIVVHADKDKVRQVLINLIGNGLKFTEKGGIEISFKKEENSACIFVKDTGRGIDVKNQSLLFRKFQQAGSSLYTRDTTKGTGLGLYISKLMVEGMKGKIWLDKSSTKEGSVFAFCVPLVFK